MHEPVLTQQFLQALASLPAFHGASGLLQSQCTILPGGLSALDLPFLLAHLQAQAESTEPWGIIAFSAGVVGIAGALALWLGLNSGTRWPRAALSLQSVVAIDGWGVPLWGLPCPFYRLSHDACTDGSSLALGLGKRHFYAMPAVTHQALWGSPQTAWGWQVDVQGRHQYINALTFIGQCLEQKV
jgi:hypothetical protein